MADSKRNLAGSSLKNVLLKCSPVMRAYGQCVATKVPAVEKDVCLKEFTLLKECVQRGFRSKA